MTKRVLVAYTSNAGSTAEVAETIGKTLGQDGLQVDVRRIKDVGGVRSYDAVLVGGPMTMGWHRETVKFVKKRQQALSQRPVAYFLTALNLTKSTETSLGATPIYQDPALAQAPKDPNKLSFKERYVTVAAYLEPVLKKAPLVKPVSAGFFAGKLDYGKLNILEKLYVKVLVRAEAGDFRNWEAIRDWAASLRTVLLEG